MTCFGYALTNVSFSKISMWLKIIVFSCSSFRISQKFFHSIHCWLLNKFCRHRMGSNLMRISSERPSLQEEYHSGSGLHSFPGFPNEYSGKSRERIQSHPELLGSDETRQARTGCLKCDSPSC